ncbi:hypothetical protein [Synechococcus sp. CBW1108]|uniref:hypothetical protein n=1 Tax=Synechococcus sp. CBW1108 TaxID=1353147 RepID=UPI0018CEA7EE|nr:hypothetical protein [Synechococcus sp. CBW1108]QPN70106.1 hypothetical protein H8F27_17070 [Synechococcus sp. CBW1108]
MDPRPPAEAPEPKQQPKAAFDLERFVHKTLSMVIGTQLLIYSLAAGVCGGGQRALAGSQAGQICPGTLEQLQGGFYSTLNLLLALLGGAALTWMDR